MAGALWTYFIPLYILGGLLLILGVFAVLGRVRGGRYLRPIMAGLAKVPGVGKLIKRASQAALERQNPELASAIRKMERYGATKDPQRAQRAISQLNAAERRAYLAAAEEQGTGQVAQNRAMRRQLQKTRKGR